MAIRPARGQHDNGAQRTVELRADGSVTVADAAALLGVTSQTVRDWIERGCPHTPGSRGRNNPTTISLSAVMQWRMDDRGGRVGAPAAVGEDGQIYDESLAKAADWHYRAIRRQADARRELGQLVPVDIIADVVEADHQAVRSILSSVAARIAVKIAAESDAAVTRRIVGDAISDAMARISSAEQTIERAGGNPRSSVNDPLDLDQEVLNDNDA